MSWLTSFLSNQGGKIALETYYVVFTLLIFSLGAFLFDEWYPNSTPGFVHSVKVWTGVADTNRRIERLWKGSFEYEAMVYVSTETFNSTDNNVAMFFDHAQLLWHINPQTTTGNTTQLFSHDVSIPITPEFKRTGQLYWHVFLQEPSKLGKRHPDVLDPHLKYYSDVLMRYPMTGGSQIMGPPSVLVDLTLVDAYSSKKSQEMSRLDIPPAPTQDTCMDEVVIAEETTSMSNTGMDEVLNVEFEVEGSPSTHFIKSDGRVSRIGIGMAPTIKTMVKDITLANPTKLQTHEYRHMIERSIEKPNIREPSEFPRRLSSVLFFIAMVGLVLISMKLNLEFWQGPNVGISRAMVVMRFFEVMYEFTMEFTVWLPLTSTIYSIYGCYQIWRISKSLELPSDPVRAKRYVMENTPENPSEVVSVRDQVDKQVLVLIQKIQWPVFAVGCVYHILYGNDGHFLLYVLSIGHAIILCCRISKALHWVPQVIINYKCKAGNFTPISIHVVDTLFVLMKAYEERQNPSEVVLRLISGLVNLVLIVQANIYNKIKQE